MMFAIERGEPRKATGGRVIGVIEPEPNMERIRGRELHIWIKPKNLVEQNGPNPDRGTPLLIGLDVRLIPGQAKAPVEFGGEVRIWTAICEEGAKPRHDILSTSGNLSRLD